jgi:hypothetical protein
MTSAAALPDSNPARAQLRLVVLGQWVRAGLALARGGAAGRGWVGGVVALWQVFQAIRLAMALIQRLSELRGALSDAAVMTTPGETDGLGSASDDWATRANTLGRALNEIAATIDAALGLAADRRTGADAVGAAGRSTRPGAQADDHRPRKPIGLRPPSLRPLLDPRRRRRRCAPVAKSPPIPIVPWATGRFRLGVG